VTADGFSDPLVGTMAAFLTENGLTVRAGAVEGKTALPGIAIEHGALVVDEAKLLHPGDLLHEAGHLAVALPEQRAAFHHDVGHHPGDEMAAIAWSYAAALHLKIDPRIVFHDEGYGDTEGDQGNNLAENFATGHYVGVPMLAWYGMAHERAKDGEPPYPHMKRWLRAA
jgi:hypothetical protein